MRRLRNHRIYLATYLRWWGRGHGLAPVTQATPGEVAAFLVAERTVLLPPVLLPILGNFLGTVRPLLPASPLLLANAHPFVTTPLFGFGADALARESELAGLGAGLAGPHNPHKWRHTLATELEVRGVASDASLDVFCDRAALRGLGFRSMLSAP